MMKKNCVAMDVFSHTAVFRLTVLLTFFLFAECAAGSCLSYGHSCWGAHGKRSGINIGNPKYLDSSRILLMRLMQQNANQRGESDKEVMREYENVPSREDIQQLMNEMEMESNPLKPLNEYDGDSDDIFGNNVPVFEGVTENHSRPSITRRISQRILKKRSTKMN